MITRTERDTVASGPDIACIKMVTLSGDSRCLLGIITRDASASMMRLAVISATINTLSADSVVGN
jgi:hypothetical protein